MEAMLVAIHQYQLSTFFFVISHMPVYAVALAKASAQGMAPMIYSLWLIHRMVKNKTA
jgi:hypothetical protein